MMTLVIGSFLAGGLLGSRLRVPAIVVVTFLGIVIIAAIGVARGEGLWDTILSMTLFAVCFEIGYLGGSFVACNDNAARAARLNSNRSPFAPTA